MSVEEHKKAARSVNCMIVTVSDTRTEETDKSGALMRELLTERGHRVTAYRIVRDEQDAIEDAVWEGAQRKDVDAILINGGTGLAARDVTLEAIEPLLDKEMPGFGELFRYLSFAEDIGSAAMLSRALGGASQGTAIFSLPGSTAAVRLGMERLILPELGHVVAQLEKDGAELGGTGRAGNDETINRP